MEHYTRFLHGKDYSLTINGYRTCLSVEHLNRCIDSIYGAVILLCFISILYYYEICDNTIVGHGPFSLAAYNILDDCRRTYKVECCNLYKVQDQEINLEGSFDYNYKGNTVPIFDDDDLCLDKELKDYPGLIGIKAVGPLFAVYTVDNFWLTWKIYSEDVSKLSPGENIIALTQDGNLEKAIYWENGTLKSIKQRNQDLIYYLEKPRASHMNKIVCIHPWSFNPTNNPFGSLKRRIK